MEKIPVISDINDNGVFKINTLQISENKQIGSSEDLSTCNQVASEKDNTEVYSISLENMPISDEIFVPYDDTTNSTCDLPVYCRSDQSLNDSEDVSLKNNEDDNNVTTKNVQNDLNEAEILSNNDRLSVSNAMEHITDNESCKSNYYNEIPCSTFTFNNQSLYNLNNDSSNFQKHSSNNNKCNSFLKDQQSDLKVHTNSLSTSHIQLDKDSFIKEDCIVENILNDEEDDEDDFSVEVRKSTSSLANGHIVNISSDFEEISLQSINTQTPSDSQSIQSKSVFRFSNFLTKNLSRISFSSENSSDEVSKTCEGPSALPNTVPTSSISPKYQATLRKSSREVPSTTALILLSRPSFLPIKNPEEETKHRLLYDELIETAKKKEQSDARKRRKRLEAQLKVEEARALATKIWNQDILPNWEIMKGTKKTMDLWWLGIPPSVRGRVWALAIANDLNVTPELYEICLSRAKEKLKTMKDSDTDSLASGCNDLTSNRESSVELIKLDVSRTFPQLCIFQKNGPYHDILQSLLGAYACYRPDVGYVQGMSFLAAVLLLNMHEVETFVCFANLLNKPCLVTFFRLDETMMKAYFETYQLLFRENMRVLYQHFHSNQISPDLYVIDWMYTLFAKPLPLDVASRVWDVFCRDGEEFLFRTALGILRLYEDILLEMDFIYAAQFLTRLPEGLSGDDLFRCISLIRMTADKLNFSQIVQRHMPVSSTSSNSATNSASRTSSPTNYVQTTTHKIS